MRDAPDENISEIKTAMNEKKANQTDQIIEIKKNETSAKADVSKNGESPLQNQTVEAATTLATDDNISNIEIQSADPMTCEQSAIINLPVKESSAATSNDAEQKIAEQSAEKSEIPVTQEKVSDEAKNPKAEEANDAEVAAPVMENHSLSEILDKYDIKLSAKKIRLLETYCQELWKINEHLNLTRHTNYEKFVTLDLLDAIHLADQLQKGEHVLDVGTGGGMPGVLLAILRPDVTVELCDSTRKKAEALGTILDAMELSLNVWYAKGENLLKVHRFHTIVIRAVSRLEKLLRDFSAVWFAFDRMLLIKGHQWVAERGEARHYNLLNNIALRKVDEYMNPGLDNPSVILQLCQKKRFEEIKKREADRLEGKPIDSQPEMIGVETGAPIREKSRGFAHKRPLANRTNGSNGSGRSSERSGKSGGGRRFGDSGRSGDHLGSDHKKSSSGSRKFTAGKRGSSSETGNTDSGNSNGGNRRSSEQGGKRSSSDHRSRSDSKRSGAPKRSFKEGGSNHQSND